MNFIECPQEIINAVKAAVKTCKETGVLKDMKVTPLTEGIGTEGLREWTGVLVDDLSMMNLKIDILANASKELAKLTGKHIGSLYMLCAAAGAGVVYLYLKSKKQQQQIDELKRKMETVETSL